MSKVSDSQRKAQKKYDEKNREKRTYLSQRSTSRGFIRNKATLEDLEELEELITARKKALAKNQGLIFQLKRTPTYRQNRDTLR